jgi:hypothetical protein
MKLFLNSLLLLTLMLSANCHKPLDVNSDFEAQYGSEIEKMRAQREMMKNSMDIMAQQAPAMPPQTIARENYQMDPALAKSNKLPDDMFQISYNTELYPPFRIIGSEFDAIKIPKTDAYGVNTEVTNKSYLLVEASSIQKSVNQINAQRSPDMIANSEAMIEKAKRIEREKRGINFASEIISNKKSAKEAKMVNENKEVVVYSMIIEDKNKKNKSIFGSSPEKKSVKN